MSTPPKSFNVAVVGCGYWGPNLIRNFADHPRSTLRWLVDLDPKRLALFTGRHPQARATTSLDEALADPELQAVAIATPVSTHFPLAKKCLEAGKHVLLEKPMATTVAHCDELLALAGRRGVTLMCDHTFVYTAAVRKMRALVESGELGDIHYFDSVRVNLGLFQQDVNVIWDLAPHDLSIMDYVLDKKPVQVAAHGACHVAGSRIENIAYLTLRFADETLAHFHVNWLAPAKIRRILVGGSRKMLVYDDLSPDEKIKIYDKGLLLKEGAAADTRQMLAGYRIGDVHVPHLDTTEALKRETDHFLDCIATGRRPETDGEAGKRVVKILVAAQESLARHGALVDL
ncbi:MAG: Gfo/Idh/MocA family oxidoreductase [Verrucomicrobia bacterium]|nr:Gfo/Idh/MocA family oxidoreductase [Verrucomicrobiota bacterium]